MMADGRHATHNLIVLGSKHGKHRTSASDISCDCYIYYWINVMVAI